MVGNQAPDFLKKGVDEPCLILYAISTMKRNLTNTQRILKFMNEHPLNQAFVMEAVSRYAVAVAADKVRLVESMRNSPVSGEAWVDSAESWVENSNK